MAELWKVWRGCLLWRIGSMKALYSCGCGRTFHINQQVCTALFEPPVGDVGNRGWVLGAVGLFSKTPDFHRRDLEKGAGSQP